MRRLPVIPTRLFKLSSVLLALAMGPLASAGETLSPMPPEPTIRGLRYQYYHGLRDLKQAIESFLDPSAEHFTYRNTREFAPDVSALRTIEVEMYERLHADYTNLLVNDEIDRYEDQPPQWRDPGKMQLPDIYLRPLRMSDTVRVKMFSVHYGFAKLLETVHRPSEDHRGDFDIFTLSRKKLPPLASAQDLSNGSERARNMIQRTLERFRRGVLEVNQQALDVARDVLDHAGEPGAGRGLGRFESESEELSRRADYLNDKLKKALEFANDRVRDQSVRLPELEALVAQLGDQLHESLLDVTRFRAELERTRRPKRPYMHDRLTDTWHELARLLGHGGHVLGVSFYSGYLERNPELPYRLFADTVTLQHVFAVGALTAKISRIAEGRGGPWERLRQTALSHLNRLRPAQGQALATTGATPAPKDFASPALVARRGEIEERLWQIFFEHAKLVRDVEYAPCGPSLIKPPERDEKEYFAL